VDYENLVILGFKKLALFLMKLFICVCINLAALHALGCWFAADKDTYFFIGNICGIIVLGVIRQLSRIKEKEET
jgi:hypothetical protein